MQPRTVKSTFVTSVRCRPYSVHDSPMPRGKSHSTANYPRRLSATHATQGAKPRRAVRRLGVG